MAFDYIVGRLKCSRCGDISDGDISTQIQTHIRDDDAAGAELKLGDSINIDFYELVKAELYVGLSSPKIHGHIKVAEFWKCHSCDSSYNWLILDIDETGKIVDLLPIRPVVKDLLDINLISLEYGLGVNSMGADLPFRLDKSGVTKFLIEKSQNFYENLDTNWLPPTAFGDELLDII